MKMSRRAERMERRHTRRLRAPGFNIISLMDIFTILPGVLPAGELQ